MLSLFLDLGYAPPSNAYLSKADLSIPEKNFPLRVVVCENCWLAQTEDFVDFQEIFNNEYAYFSSTSSSWMAHSKDYVEKITDFLDLNEASFIVEIAANDGYLLKNFVDSNIPCLGIEPTKSTATAARKVGVPILENFFSSELAEDILKSHPKADLVIANNVFAHVPDINDFTKGLKVILSQTGTITLEFPHILELFKNNRFDTIYHEHFSYLSLKNVIDIFDRNDLAIYDVEKIKTHGGSLRVFGCHKEYQVTKSTRVEEILNEELSYGLQSSTIYQIFQSKVDEIKLNFLDFLIMAKKNQKSIIGYGAAAKGNTLLNYCGVRADLIPMVVDSAKSKQGMYLPGSHIPVFSPEILDRESPDYIFILPWNIANEIMELYGYLKEKGSKFVVLDSKLNFF